VLRLYDLGKRRLLRKCENKSFPSSIVSIHAYRDRIYVGDIQEVCFYQFLSLFVEYLDI
jgi:splicing factor 3B subunit 3